MDFEIIEEKKNDLMKRNELLVEVKHPGKPTPKKIDVLAAVCAKKNFKKENTILKRFTTLYGSNKSRGWVFAYESEESMKGAESPKIIVKGLGKEKAAGEEKEEAKPEKAEAEEENKEKEEAKGEKKEEPEKKKEEEKKEGAKAEGKEEPKKEAKAEEKKEGKPEEKESKPEKKKEKASKEKPEDEKEKGGEKKEEGKEKKGGSE